MAIISINKSNLFINRSNFNINPIGEQPYTLIGYIGYPNVFIGDCTSTGTTANTPIYSPTTSLLQSGQTAINKSYYYNNNGTGLISETSGYVYSFSTISGSTPYRQLRFNGSGLLDATNVCGTLTGFGYYVNFSQPADVGSTNQLWSAADDVPPYVGGQVFSTSVNSYFSSGQTIGYASTSNKTAEYLITFGDNTIIESITPVNMVAQFNFNNTAQSVSGWTDVSGNPNTAVRSATYGSTGIGVHSVATGRWIPFGNTSTNTGGETVANSVFVFPSTVTASYWFTYQTVLTSSEPNLIITGLTVGNTYRIDILGSRDDSAVPLSQRLMFVICVDDNGAETSSDFNVKQNTQNTITFTNKVPTTSGEIQLVINPKDAVNNQFGYLNGLRIIQE